MLEVTKRGMLNGIIVRLKSNEVALYTFLDVSSFPKISEVRLPCPLGA